MDEVKTLLHKHVDHGGELFGRLEHEGVAAFEVGQPGERNLVGDYERVFWWIDGV